MVSCKIYPQIPHTLLVIPLCLCDAPVLSTRRGNLFLQPLKSGLVLSLILTNRMWERWLYDALSPQEAFPAFTFTLLESSCLPRRSQTACRRVHVEEKWGTPANIPRQLSSGDCQSLVDLPPDKHKTHEWALQIPQGDPELWEGVCLYF